MRNKSFDECTGSGSGGSFGVSEGKAKETRRFHESIPAYNRTPLVQLRGLGGKLGVKGIFVKNEAERFGMKAF